MAGLNKKSIFLVLVAVVVSDQKGCVYVCIK